MKFRLLFAGIIFAAIGCQDNNLPETATNDQEITPKNVILLIGDGMGLSQVSVAQFEMETPSNFERFPVIGLCKTSSSKELITDSAAAGTAFACGVKTYNGAIGVSSDSTEVTNISEILAAKNISSGIVGTSSITHATLASFYAHAVSRDYHEAIAADLLASNMDYFAGGGLKYFNARKDSLNVLSGFLKKGFTVDTLQLPAKAQEKMAILLAKKAMPTILEGRGDFLTKASELGIACLSKNTNGFFLMIEGSQIDWGGHDNDSAYLTAELLDFDAALGAVLDYAAQDGETLVIVTADHETGGFTLASDGSDYNKISPSFSTGGHSATMVPVFAYGPGAEKFGGIYQNTKIFDNIKALMIGD